MDNPNATGSEAASTTGTADTTADNSAQQTETGAESMTTEGAETTAGTETGTETGREEPDPDSTAEPDITGDPEQLLYDGEPLPDFEPPFETEREKALREELEDLRQKVSTGRALEEDEETPPQRPDRESFYSDEEYDKALRQYFTDKDEFDQREAKQAAATENAREQFSEAVSAYCDKRTVVATKLHNFDRYESHADLNLNPLVMAAIVFGGQSGTFDNAPEMMYAIGRNPALLEKLNETNNPFLAGAMLLDISKKSRMAPAAPKKVTSAIPDVTGIPNPDGDVLAAAKEKARDSGDYTEYLKLKEKLKK